MSGPEHVRDILPRVMRHIERRYQRPRRRASKPDPRDHGSASLPVPHDHEER